MNGLTRLLELLSWLRFVLLSIAAVVVIALCVTGCTAEGRAEMDDIETALLLSILVGGWILYGLLEAARRRKQRRMRGVVQGPFRQPRGRR